MAKSPTYVLVGPVTCMRTSLRAVLVKFNDREYWFPRSALHETENEINETGDVGMLIAAEWIVKEKGLL